MPPENSPETNADTFLAGKLQLCRHRLDTSGIEPHPRRVIWLEEVDDAVAEALERLRMKRTLILFVAAFSGTASCADANMLKVGVAFVLIVVSTPVAGSVGLVH